MGERASTRGPWKVTRRYEVGPVSDADDQSYGMVLALCDVYGDNRAQDARLIAAAPDMFEALLQARDWLEGWVSAEPQLAIIEAALAKATPTGEASDV